MMRWRRIITLYFRRMVIPLVRVLGRNPPPPKEPGLQDLGQQDIPEQRHREEGPIKQRQRSEAERRPNRRKGQPGADEHNDGRRHNQRPAGCGLSARTTESSFRNRLAGRRRGWLLTVAPSPRWRRLQLLQDDAEPRESACVRSGSLICAFAAHGSLPGSIQPFTRWKDRKVPASSSILQSTKSRSSHWTILDFSGVSEKNSRRARRFIGCRKRLVIRPKKAEGP
jgi:hypothetical protein